MRRCFVFLFFLLFFTLTEGQVNVSPECNTSTFRMEIPAAAGEKIELKAAQPFANRDFLLVGNVFRSTGAEGLLARIGNMGNVKIQHLLRVNNLPTTIANAKALPDGRVVINGFEHNGYKRVFIAVLSSNLQVEWVRHFSLPEDLQNLTLDLAGEETICWASQHQSDAIYGALSLQGDVKWQKRVTVDGLTSLHGFGVLGWIPFGIISNVTRNGSKGVVITEVDQSNGSLVSSHAVNSGQDEVMALATSSFATRQTLLRVGKSGANTFQLQRSLHATSASAEVTHTYTLPLAPDFSLTGAMDHAGDAMGVLFPGQGKLVFIYQFNNYQTAPLFTRQYDVPKGASLQSLTRCFDAGFLFGMTDPDSSNIILIKTDSTGTLPGCGYTTLQNDFTEVFNQPNYSSGETISDIPVIQETASAGMANSTLAPTFVCRQFYCPPPPAEDSCLQTFYKGYRSFSYADFVDEYHLLRNNRHVWTRYRYDRILGGSNRVTATIELLSEKGQRIKGGAVHQGGRQVGFTTRKMSDSTVMIITFESGTAMSGPPVYTFTLINDNLEPLWSTSFSSDVNVDFTGSGNGMNDMVRDAEGNYYFVLVRSGGFQQVQPGVAVYKMNAKGEALWLKAYAVNMETSFGYAGATTTGTSLILIVEGAAMGVSMRLDKNTGALQATYGFNKQYNGVGYRRLVKFEKDRIFYGGSSAEDHFVMAVFDTLGRATKIRQIQSYDVMRAGDVKNGELYVSFRPLTGGSLKDIVLKADSSLNLVFYNEYDLHDGGMPKGLAVSDEGTIYVVGNNAWGTNANYIEPYLKKFTNGGELGICHFQPGKPVIIDIDPQVQPLAASPIDKSFQTPLIPVTILPDTEGLVVSAIHCSSVATCSYLQLTGAKALCNLDTAYTFRFLKDQGCSIRPMLSVDTAFVVIEKITDSTAQLRFKKAGSTWLKATLNAGCKIFSDSLQVQLSGAPAILNLGTDRELCPRNTLVLNARKGYTTHQWQDGSTDSVYTVREPGLYHVTTTDACGGTFRDTVVVTAAAPIPFTVGPDRTKCNSDTVQLAAPAGFLNYSWSNNYNISSTSSQTVVLNPQVDTAYYIKAEKTPGCFAFDTVRINVYTSPAINMGPDLRFCAGDSVLLDAGSGFASYQWSTGAATQNISAKGIGSYTVTGTTLEGCKSMDTVQVLQVYTLPQPKLHKKSSLCQGESKTLDAGAFAAYRWQDGSTGRTYTVSGMGQYSVTVTDQNGCSSSDSTAITTILPLPAGFLPQDTAICSYGTLQLKTSSSYTTYQWSTGGSTPFITVSQPGTYTLIVKDNNGCSGKDTVSVAAKDCLAGFYVPTAFTPNGDGKNDLFRPLLFGNVKRYRFTVYDRWGEVVFQTTEVQKGWNGKVTGLHQETSVFVWTCTYQVEGGEMKQEKGTVMLVR